MRSTNSGTVRGAGVEEHTMAGLAVITEACIAGQGSSVRGCLPRAMHLRVRPSHEQARSGKTRPEAGSSRPGHTPNADVIGIFGDTILYVNLDECTSCTACDQPDVCPVGAIYAGEHVPDGLPHAGYNRCRPQRRPRPHVLHPAQPGCLRRLTVQLDRSAFLKRAPNRQVDVARARPSRGPMAGWSASTRCGPS